MNRRAAEYLVLIAAWALLPFSSALAAGGVGLKSDFLVTAASGDKEPGQGTVTAGNGIYNVHVQDISSSAVGTYTATTGPSHPAGPGLNVLFGGGSPGTSFNTIRSYTTGTDYVQVPGRSSTNTVVYLAPFGSVTPIGTTGFRTTYVLPGPGVTPDALTVLSDLNVNGTTFQDSSISVTTSVTNNGATSVEIGIRYHWDFQIGSDDGPTLQQISPDGAVLVNETEFAPPTFVQYRIVDNDINPTPPTFFIFGTATGPSGLLPPPTAPAVLQYVCWPSAVSTAFDYTVNPSLDIATTASSCRGSAGGDTAVHYFFGANQASPIAIPPGGEVTVSASIFLSTSPEPPQVPSTAPAPALGPWGLLGVAVLLLLVGVIGSRGVRTSH